MKRCLIATVITVALILVNVLTMLDLKENSVLLLQSIDGIQQTMEAGDYEQLEKQASDFKEQWMTMERKMSGYIRHNELEAITAVVSRLPALARYNAHYELYADCEQVRTLIEHLVEFETPGIFKIFDEKS